MCHFMGNGLVNKVMSVFAQQNRIQPNQVSGGPGLPCRFTSQVKLDIRLFERTMKVSVCLFEQ